MAQPYQNPQDKRIRERLRQGNPGRMPYSWLYQDLVKNVSREKTGHPCQIPERLSELLLKATAQAGDAVFILFGGSGSEVLQAHKMGLTWLTCELQPEYSALIRRRLKESQLTLPAPLQPLKTQEAINPA